MEITTWVDLLIYLIFTLGMLLVGLPLGVRLSYFSIKRLLVKGNQPYSEDIIAKIFAKTPAETLFVGLLLLVGSMWVLFFDRGGAFLMLYSKVSIFIIA